MALSHRIFQKNDLERLLRYLRFLRILLSLYDTSEINQLVVEYSQVAEDLGLKIEIQKSDVLQYKKWSVSKKEIDITFQ